LMKISWNRWGNCQLFLWYNFSTNIQGGSKSWTVFKRF